MKKHLSKKAFWQSLLSLTALGIFILLATGTAPLLTPEEFDTFFTETEYLGDGVFEETEYLDLKDERRIIKGKTDKNGRWHGPVTISIKCTSCAESYEEVNMENGMRHGKSVLYEGGNVYTKCYKMDQPVKCEEAARKSMADVSSFQVLRNQYPWFLYTLNALDFENEYVEAYLDTLEILLATYDFEDLDFDVYYQQVIDSLVETVYDSIITLNSILSIHQGLGELKNDELRMAL